QGRTSLGKRGGSVTERTAAVLEVQPVHGIPEVKPGTDLGSLLSDTLTELGDADVVVVTSKIVSKAEGRVSPGVSRDDAIEAETVRLVAERDSMGIVETKGGLGLAAAGGEASKGVPGSGG